MIRVVICDDHAIVRRGLRQILLESGQIEVIAECSNYVELRDSIPLACNLVLLLDIELPGKNGIEVLEIVRKDFPKISVIMLSLYPEDQYAIRALKSGAMGYLNKNSAPDKLVDAVIQVASGRKFISPEVSQVLADRVTKDTREEPHNQLTNREFQVLRMIASGKRLSDIADALFLSPKTVSVYRARILEKLQVSNNVELAYYASRHGLVQSPGPQK